MMASASSQSNPASMSATPRKTLWAWVSGTFFGIGMVGKGGGTIAAAATMALWWVAARYLNPAWLVPVTITSVVVAAAVGVPAGSVVARECGKKDPSEVVLDEVAGQLIALIAVPFHWKYLLASFILFRIFDIFKPPPVRQLEKLKGGLGIMMDDVAAGLYALLMVQALHGFNIF